MTDDLAPGTRWTIGLWPYDAIVLFDWLMTVDFGQIPVEHKAQKQALADLLTVLETQAPRRRPHAGPDRQGPGRSIQEHGLAVPPTMTALPGRVAPARWRPDEATRRQLRL